jgi:hypothetical protein
MILEMKNKTETMKTMLKMKILMIKTTPEMELTLTKIMRTTIMEPNKIKTLKKMNNQKS